MNAEAIVMVSAAVVALVQLVKWAGLKDSYGPLAVLIASVLGVGLWTFDQFRESGLVLSLFGAFAGVIAVMTSAAGVFGFSRSASDTLTRMRGTGEGGQ